MRLQCVTKTCVATWEHRAKSQVLAVHQHGRAPGGEKKERMRRRELLQFAVVCICLHLQVSPTVWDGEAAMSVGRVYFGKDSALDVRSGTQCRKICYDSHASPLQEVHGF